MAREIFQGSATSGEAAAITPWRERGYEDEHSDVAMMAEIADLRAALAASAEQSNSAPLMGVKYMRSLARSLRNEDEMDRSHYWAIGHDAADYLDKLANGAAPVAERAAAPASVPEDARLNALLHERRKAIVALDGEAQKSVERRIIAHISFRAAAPEVAQPAAQGESVQQELYEFVAMLSLQSGGMISGNRLSARAKELLAKMESSAPTAGEPSARTDELCNSALRAEPAGQHDAAIAVLSAVRDGIPLQEPVNITKAVLAQREARVSLSGGTGPVACAMLVNIQLTGWAEGPETAKAFAGGYNTAIKWFRASLLDLADKVSAAAATRSRAEGGITCPQCGVDRIASPCPTPSDCGMIGTAHIKATQGDRDA